MDMADVIRRKLDAALAPSVLEITDESERHRGHAGWREGGQTHFHVRIASPRFDGLSRVARHRLINQALADELVSSIHALRISIAT